MRHILILIIFLVVLQAGDFKSISLLDFTDRVSKQTSKTIYIDEDLNSSISLFIPDNISNIDLLKVYTSTLNKLGFNFKKIGNVNYISRKVNFTDKNHIYKLKFDTFVDCDLLLKSFGVKYTFFKDINAFMLICTDNEFKKYSKLLKVVDVIQSQVTLKITIFEYSTNLAKERGVQYGSIYQSIDGSVKTALNTIIMPFNTNNPILSSADFYGAIRLLNSQEDINIKQNPFILAKNNERFKFEAVENIPYLVTTTTTEATNTSNQTSIEYKDVGLKISGKAFIHKDFVTLDLALIVEDLITDTKDDTMPETYKRSLQSNSDIEYGKVLLLSGLKRTRFIKNNFSIPYISNIPWLGELFKYKSTTDKEVNITISIEVVKSNNEEKIVSYN